VASAAPEVLLMVDPNWRPGAVEDSEAWRTRLDRMLARADVVKLSTEDLADLSPGVAVPDAARGLLSDRTRCVLVTDGGGAVTVACTGGMLEVEPPRVTVADTVGAGDAFGAGFLAWCTAHRLTRESLGDPAQVRDAADFAALIAARTCARVGADPPRLLELETSAGLAAA
jgi:fructokinase